jgi:hypothetical protein
VDKIKKTLARKFIISEFGPLTWFLNLRVVQDLEQGTIVMTQDAYITEIAERFRIDQAKCCYSPLQGGAVISKDQEPKNEEEKREMADKPYRGIIGAILHAARATRPDVCFAATALSRHLTNPGKQHWKMAQGVLKYLYTTKDDGIKFTRQEQGLTLEAYSDASFNEPHQDSRSTSGFTIKLSGGPIAWASKTQKFVSLSTAESELYAATLCGQEVVWVRDILAEIGFPQLEPTTIYEDNKAVIEMIKNDGTHHAKAKHISKYKYWMRQRCQDTKELTLIYVDTVNNQADEFTKALPRAQHNFLREMICGYQS